LVTKDNQLVSGITLEHTVFKVTNLAQLF